TGNVTISTVENTPHVFALTDFPFADPSDSNALQAVVFVSLPGGGAITDNNVAVAQGQAVLASDIAAGKVVFTPAANTSGSTTFSFEVQDNGNFSGGGSNTSSPATATINVAAVNHAPTTGPTTISAAEVTAYTFKLSDFPFSDPSDQLANALKA